MRALGYLLGARAIDQTNRQSPGRRNPERREEPDFLPIATTPERARAWRAWARAQAGPTAGPTAAPGGLAGDPARTRRVFGGHGPLPEGDAA
jgi:hypothetical protein